MKRFTGCRLVLAVGFAALALGANVQAATSGNTTAAPKTQSAMKHSTTKAKSSSASRGTHRAAARRGRPADAMASNAGDSAYRAALRRCVTGPEQQRDSCLDDAIARYAHA
jgi:hypothetical protein